MVKKIIQLTHTYSIGDAISNYIKEIHEFCTSEGIISKVFALAVHPSLKDHAAEAAKLENSEIDAVFFHFSLGGEIVKIFEKIKARVKILVFHNITPPQYFENINSTVCENIRNGLNELKNVVSKSDLVVTVSNFNLEDLKPFIKNQKTFVLPIPVPSVRDISPTLLDRLNWLAVPNQIKKAKMKMLYVGRIAPNKNLELCIKTFAAYRKCYEGDSLLWLVGSSLDCELYKGKLLCLAETLGVADRTFFWGFLSDGLLNFLYQNASVYLALSHHEGFCVPIIEAIKSKVPVIGRKGTAIEETLGKNGVLVSTDDPLELAGIIHSIINDQYGNLVLKQLERLEEFSRENFAKRLKEILECINDRF